MCESHSKIFFTVTSEIKVYCFQAPVHHTETSLHLLQAVDLNSPVVPHCTDNSCDNIHV